eukprot:GCRY01005378.1.p1 GENE.GCRY01005378.1~~GCRY01005378.1.p1  ORF type:complete len:415 (+),score=-3.23 GCRY01005378.1:269-1513(+)
MEHSSSNDSKTGAVLSFFNLVKGFVGSGIFGLPYAFQQAGVILGCLGIFIIAFISNYCMNLLVETRKKLNSSNYLLSPELSDDEFNTSNQRKNNSHDVPHSETMSLSDIAYALFGSIGLYVVMGSLFLMQLGFCTAYVRFWGETLHSVYSDISMELWICLATPFLFLLSLVQTLKKLSFTSVFGLVSLFVGLLLIYFESFKKISSETINVDYFDVNRAGTFFGIALYAFEAVGLILPIEAKYKNPRTFPVCLASSLFAAALLYSSFASVCYLSYEADTKDIITQNLPHHSVVVVIVKIFIAIALVFTHPLQLFPVVSHIEASLKNGSNSLSFFGIRIIMVGVTVFVAVIVPDFHTLLALVGSIACSIIGFIVPPILHIKVLEHCSWARLLMNLLVATLGVFGLVFGTYSAVLDF